jgi:Glycosyl-4,4'-diaponeurosporenoate acyltransferase
VAWIPTVVTNEERGFTGHPGLQKLLDAWFSPKRFASEKFYERLGVLFIKRYVPTGGDFFIRRYEIRIAHIRGSLESLIHFERYTPRLEAIHEVAFLGFLAFSLRRAILRHRQTTLLDFGFAVLVYVALILSPAMLQRYNRLRVAQSSDGCG